MARILFLISETYPYGKGEPFLETEVKFYKDFDKVIILPSFCGDLKLTRKFTENNIEIIRSDSAFFKDKLYSRVLNSLLILRKKIFWTEIKKIIKKEKLSIKTISHLISFLSKGESVYKFAKKWILVNCDSEDEIIFYSYWMYYQAYAAVRLSSEFKKSKSITRAHGFDLYEYRNKDNYIPMRKYILDKIDRIYTISNDGLNYINDNYNVKESKVTLSRLGTTDLGISVIKNNSNKFILISCSRMVPIKRINRIIAALSKITSIDIHWIHFGDGECFNTLKNLALNSLPSNITFNFKGAIPNSEILEYYKKNYNHLFINVSETEGLPVSIMEAISFGIPVLATDVGGTNEIVIDEYNGYLINENFSDIELSDKIKSIIQLENSKYIALRINARQKWLENFKDELNYSVFIKSTKNI